MKTSKVFLSGITHQALASSDLPAELRLLKFGENETQQGIFRVTPRTVNAIEAQLAGQIFDRVLVDFEHNSEKKHPNYQPPPRKHAGVGVPGCTEEKGLFLSAIEWTPHGHEYAKDYPDLSPALIYDAETREVIGLSSVALCPQGAVYGLSFFQAEDTNPQETEMTIEKLAAALEQLTAQFTEFKTAIEAKTSALKAVTLDQIPDLKPLEAKIAALEADLRTEAARQQKALLVVMAKHEGKAVALTDEAIASLSVESLVAHLAAIKPTVPLTPKTQDERGAAAAQLTATQKLVAAQLGITEPEKVFGKQ